MCKENRGRVQVLKIQRNPGGHPGVCAVFYYILFSLTYLLSKAEEVNTHAHPYIKVV